MWEHIPSLAIRFTCLGRDVLTFAQTNRLTPGVAFVLRELSPRSACCRNQVCKGG